MFGIGMQELILILVLALIVLGPKRLPEIARALGKGMAEFRRAADDFKEEFRQMEREIEESSPEATETDDLFPAESGRQPETSPPPASPLSSTAAESEKKPR